MLFIDNRHMWLWHVLSSAPAAAAAPAAASIPTTGRRAPAGRRAPVAARRVPGTACPTTSGSGSGNAGAMHGHGQWRHKHDEYDLRNTPCSQLQHGGFDDG